MAEAELAEAAKAAETMPAPAPSPTPATKPMQEMHRRPGEDQESFDEAVKFDRDITELKQKLALRAAVPEPAVEEPAAHELTRIRNRTIAELTANNAARELRRTVSQETIQ
jgi:hypothetical protein